MKLIEKLNNISNAWKRQFEEPGTTYWNRNHFGSAPDLPLEWTIDENGMLYLDSVWICPARYLDEAELVKEVDFVTPVSFEISLIDGTANIIISKYNGEYAIAGVERSVINCARREK